MLNIYIYGLFKVILFLKYKYYSYLYINKKEYSNLFMMGNFNL